MAEAYITRRDTRVKTGIVTIPNDPVGGSGTNSLTIPALSGVKNALIVSRRTGSYGIFRPIASITIEDGAITYLAYAHAVSSDRPGIDYLSDLSVISFDPTTGTIVSNRSDMVFVEGASYQYIIY